MAKKNVLLESQCHYICIVIKYEEFQLENGLKVIHHFDPKKSTAVLNLLYNVGARDEDSEKTGFAHLFEHLMFEGSENVASFDSELQKAGGVNNAFTSNDITNYYIEVPAVNIETAFWLESDRMKQLAFSEESLKVQQGVVIEEFKQRYLNQPYGKVYMHMRELAYKKHPYRWATIGKEISHIQNATLQDVIDFFNKFYHPGNAVLCLAGNISLQKVKDLTVKWFGDIPNGVVNENKYVEEPKQIKSREFFAPQKNAEKSIYIGFHKPEKKNKINYAGNILASLLTDGEDSYLYQVLVKTKKIFSSINSYNGSENDPGLFYIMGKLNKGYNTRDGLKAVMDEIENLKVSEFINETKVKGKVNKLVTSKIYQDTNLLNRAMSLCFGKNEGNINLINEDLKSYKNVEVNQLKLFLNRYLIKENSNTIHYDEINK